MKEFMMKYQETITAFLGALAVLVSFFDGENRQGWQGIAFGIFFSVFIRDIAVSWRVRKRLALLAERTNQSDNTVVPSDDQGADLGDYTQFMPSNFDLPDNVTFTVYRGTQVSNKPATFAELVNFVKACGIKADNGEVMIASIVAGLPFEIDGASMRFVIRKSD